MTTIGTFTRSTDGTLVGTIRTLTLETAAQLEPLAIETKGAPDLRLRAGDIELGAAWAKTARETGLAYHQVRIDDPSFVNPIFASLFADDEEAGTYRLVWSRPRRGSQPIQRRTGRTEGSGSRAKTGRGRGRH